MLITLKSRKNIAQDIPNIIIGLFDSDHEGRKQIKEFRSCDNVDGTEFIRITNNKPLYAGLLPLPEEIKKLNQEDQNDILMEMNSHIYESMSKNEDENDELKNLINTLDKIGIPNDVLKPLVAEKKLNQATKTFNPIHIFEALILNFSYGIIYFIFFILYLFLFSFVVLIFAKLFYPNNVGFFYKKGEIFQYGGFIENEKLGREDFTKEEIKTLKFLPAKHLISLKAI